MRRRCWCDGTWRVVRRGAGVGVMSRMLCLRDGVGVMGLGYLRRTAPVSVGTEDCPRAAGMAVGLVLCCPHAAISAAGSGLRWHLYAMRVRGTR